jgi:hypothetical protein
VSREQIMSNLEGTPLHEPDATGDSEDHTPHEAVTITIKPSGTFVINGPVTILDNEGRVIPPPVTKNPAPVKLCGCGHTQSAPFCDGSHKR